MDEIVNIILYIVAIINVVLSITVLARGFRNANNVWFGVFVLSAAAWSISIIGFRSPNSFGVLTIEWVKFTHFFALLTSLVFLFFSIGFPQKLNISKYQTYILFLASALVSYNLLSTDSIVGTTQGVAYVIGPGYLWYGMVFSANFLASYYFLYLQYKQAQSMAHREQIKYVVTGAVLAPLLASIPDLILPFFEVFNYTWLGPIFTLIMVVAIFAAILRHGLFNIKVILTELLVVLIIVLLLVELILAQTALQVFATAGVLIVVSIFSYLLIRSVYREVEAREQIEKLAQDLEMANKRLKDIDQLKSEFVSIASHQLRSPLAAIKGYASLILEGSFGKAPPAIGEAVDKIFQSSKNLVLIVEDFLTISRIEQGRMKYEFADTDIYTLIRTISEELAPSVKRAGLEIILKHDESYSYKASVDLGKIKQVFSNLIDNAIKYTPKGSITIYVSKPQEAVVRVEIRDTGIGMEPNTIAVLFQKFSRATDANKTNVIGTGLGLYVAKEMVEAHGGKIWAESEGKGKGSTFVVELRELEHQKMVSEVNSFASTL